MGESEISAIANAQSALASVPVPDSYDYIRDTDEFPDYISDIEDLNPVNYETQDEHPANPPEQTIAPPQKQIAQVILTKSSAPPKPTPRHSPSSRLQQYLVFPRKKPMPSPSPKPRSKPTPPPSKFFSSDSGDDGWDERAFVKEQIEKATKEEEREVLLRW
jgi:hypothetical protein